MTLRDYENEVRDRWSDEARAWAVTQAAVASATILALVFVGALAAWLWTL